MISLKLGSQKVKIFKVFVIFGPFFQVEKKKNLKKKMDFHPLVRNLHEKCGTSVPIARFAKLIDPKGLGFASRRELYKPVRFNVKLADNQTHGTVQLDVPVHANEDSWLDDMRSKIASMIDVNPHNIELRTLTGQPLHTIPSHRLHKVGDLNVVLKDNGCIARVKNEAPPVPVEYSINKARHLKEWYSQKVAKGLPEKVAALLSKCNNNVEIDDAIRGRGGVQQTIERHLLDTAKPDWPEFVRVHHVNADGEANVDNADLLLTQISNRILGNVRSMVSAYKTDVARHLAHKMSQAIEEMGGKTSHFKPILSDISSSSASSASTLQYGTNGYKLFSRIASDALQNPSLEAAVVRAVNLESPALRQQKLQKQRHVEQELTASHHPWYAHIHHTMMPISGQFPSDYIARHTQKDMSANAPFTGNVDKTYQAYQLFSGQHVAPKSLTVKAGKPIGQAVSYETLVARSMPGKRRTLVPIEGHCKLSKKHSKGHKGKKHYCKYCEKKGKQCNECAKAAMDMKAELVPIAEHADLSTRKGFDFQKGPKQRWQGEYDTRRHQRHHHATQAKKAVRKEENPKEKEESEDNSLQYESTKSEDDPDSNPETGLNSNNTNAKIYFGSPINSSKDREPSGRRMPELIPVNASVETFKAREPSDRRMPELIPINSSAGHEEDESLEDIDELPSVADIFK